MNEKEYGKWYHIVDTGDKLRVNFDNVSLEFPIHEEIIGKKETRSVYVDQIIAAFGIVPKLGIDYTQIK